MFNIGDIVGYNPERFVGEILKTRGQIIDIRNSSSGLLIEVIWKNDFRSVYKSTELTKINNLPKDLFGKAIIC
jgi:hypothetical protein